MNKRHGNGVVQAYQEIPHGIVYMIAYKGTAVTILRMFVRLQINGWSFQGHLGSTNVH